MAAHTGCSSFVEEKATACHSEPFAVILSGQSEMLRFAQHDSERAQNDRQWGYPLRMTDIAYQLPEPGFPICASRAAASIHLADVLQRPKEFAYIKPTQGKKRLKKA
jgi:hypothetical protein